MQKDMDMQKEMPSNIWMWGMTLVTKMWVVRTEILLYEIGGIMELTAPSRPNIKWNVELELESWPLPSNIAYGNIKRIDHEHTQHNNL